ncbi:hypothetical protein ACO0QE_003942 [Hanseniaspora vineae]
MVTSNGVNEKWDTVISLLQDLFNANEVIPFDYHAAKNANAENPSDAQSETTLSKQKELQHKDNCSRGKRILQEIQINLDGLLKDLDKNFAANLGNQNGELQTNGTEGADSKHTLVHDEHGMAESGRGGRKRRKLLGTPELQELPASLGKRGRPSVHEYKNDKSDVSAQAAVSIAEGAKSFKDGSLVPEDTAALLGRRRKHASEDATDQNANTKTSIMLRDDETKVPAHHGTTSSKNVQHGKSFYASEYNANEPVLLGSQVAYKPMKKNSGITDWFQCEVTKILNSEGTKFEIKDPEPDDFGNPGASYKCNWKEILLIPPHPNIASARKLKAYPVGTKVLAKYPETTTFYSALVIGKTQTKNGLPTCILRFDGEEEVDKETEVERFWVLPFPKK